MRGDVLQIPLYQVTIPIAGHAIVNIRAANKKKAINNALDSIDEYTAVEWDTLEQFNKGDVCYCPLPWEIKVDDIDDDHWEAEAEHARKKSRECEPTERQMLIAEIDRLNSYIDALKKAIFSSYCECRTCSHYDVDDCLAPPIRCNNGSAWHFDEEKFTEKKG